MFGSEVLEVGIGLAIIFAFVSLVCTSAREALEGLLKSRALDLERGIRELLADPTGTGYARKLFNHPLIRSLFSGDYDPTQLKVSRSVLGGARLRHMRLSARRHLPSYIPAASFVSALLDIVADREGASGKAPLSPAALREAAGKIANEQLRGAVLSAVDAAEGDLGQVRANLEQWFNGTMERASGWYRRRTQGILFVLGLAIGAVLNVDAISIAEHLVSDRALREVVVKQAEALGAARQGGEEAKLREAIADIGLPIGWRDGWPRPQAPKLRCGEGYLCLAGLYTPEAFLVLVGWLITALATMLGAPFWFDVLGRFMVVRSTVKPRERSPDEGSQGAAPEPAPARRSHR
jgi:hypothetical protein